MTDSLENKIGIALRASQYQMVHSDAKEGLTYMHERVEELRGVNSWSDLYTYFKRHHEIVSFLRHLGFREFDEEQLRVIYNGIVNAVYHPEVVDDPQPRAQVAAWKAREDSLRVKLGDAKRWSDYLANHDLCRDPSGVLNLPKKVYMAEETCLDEHGVSVKRDIDLVEALIHVSKVALRSYDVENWLKDIFEDQHWRVQGRAKLVLEGLSKYDERKPTFLNGFSMISEAWFGPPFSMRDVIFALRGDWAYLKQKAEDNLKQSVEEEQAYRNPDYVNKNQAVREEINQILGQLDYLGFPKLLDEFDGIVGTTQDAENRRQRVVKSGANITYHILDILNCKRVEAEALFGEFVRHIQEIHPAVVDKWSDARTDLSAQLRESSRNKEIWERDWRKNYAGVQRSNQLKQDALNHPWMNNTHPTFNTSAYSAKLVGLSVQLESLQSGNPHSPNRLMRG